MPQPAARHFTLQDVPAAMRREHWTLGATLMDRWFKAPAWTMPPGVKSGDTAAPAAAVDTQTVKMTALLRYARFAAANAHLLATWAQPPRRERSAGQLATQVHRWIARHGIAPNRPFRFGTLTQSVVEIDRTCAINRDLVDSPWYDSVDDFYAAFGRAAVKLAVSGEVVPAKDGLHVTIDQAVTYLRDTYDFNGDQPLGSWGPDGLSRIAVLAPAIDVDPAARESFLLRGQKVFSVSNQSYRAYRARFNKGGDFVVFSDLQRAAIAPPVTFVVPA